MKEKLIFNQAFVDFLRSHKEAYDKEMKEETARQQASGENDMSEVEEKAIPSPYITLNEVYTWVDIGVVNTEVTELVVSCSDFEAYKKLPEALFYKKASEKAGVVCGKKGWNSDRNVAYYGSNKAVAQVV